MRLKHAQADTIKSRIQTDERYAGRSFTQVQCSLTERDIVRSPAALPYPKHPSGSPAARLVFCAVAQVFQIVLREEGVGALYRGCAITCARAVPSHAAIFYLYEVASAWLARL